MKYSDIPAEDVLAALGRAFPDLIFIIDSDGRYQAVLGGRDRSKYHDPQSLPHLIGLTFHDVMPAALADRMLDAVRHTLRHNDVHTITYTLDEKDIAGYDSQPGPAGAQCFEARLSPIRKRDGATADGVVALVYNITDRVRTEAQLELEARTDELTGLGNRRAFIEHATGCASAARRYGHPLALAVMDIDHFKTINDRHGHEAGDVVLRSLAELMLGELRDADFLARIGGEEFALLLPFTTLADAYAAAERLCAGVRDARFRFNGEALRITLSIGLAGFPEDRDVDPLSHMLRQADQALYAAKHQGRDRVVVSGEPR